MNDNFCIMTNVIYDRIPQYVQVSDRNKTRYCLRHGITFLNMRVNPRPDSHPVWSKPSLMAWALEQYRWCIWMDADAIPLNLGFDVAGYLSSVEEPVVMGQDINGFNAGVFAVRDDARDWLLKIDSRRKEYTRGFKEQQAMSDSIGAGEVKCHIPPLEIGWNDYIPELYNRTCDKNIYRRGQSWVLHLPAVKDCDRAYIMQGETQL